MRRPFVMTTGALALALLPAAVFAQTPPPAQTPAQPPAAAQPAPADKPAEPKLGFTTPAGLLLVQVKPDQTAAFEELASKLQAALSTTSDAALKAQGAAWKIYKASEPMGGNALYVMRRRPRGCRHGVQPHRRALQDDDRRAEARARDPGDVQAVRRGVRRRQQAEHHQSRRISQRRSRRFNRSRTSRCGFELARPDPRHAAAFARSASRASP